MFWLDEGSGAAGVHRRRGDDGGCAGIVHGTSTTWDHCRFCAISLSEQSANAADLTDELAAEGTRLAGVYGLYSLPSRRHNLDQQGGHRNERVARHRPCAPSAFTAPLYQLRRHPPRRILTAARSNARQTNCASVMCGASFHDSRIAATALSSLFFKKKHSAGSTASGLSFKQICGRAANAARGPIRSPSKRQGRLVCRDDMQWCRVRDTTRYHRGRHDRGRHHRQDCSRPARFNHGRVWELQTFQRGLTAQRRLPQRLPAASLA